MGRKLDASLAILNGTIGDYLARTGNGLATEMQLFDRVGGQALSLDTRRVGPRLEGASGKAVVLVHGLMCTEEVWEMTDRGDSGLRLARDFAFAPLYLRYNSGRSIADNGA